MKSIAAARIALDDSTLESLAARRRTHSRMSGVLSHRPASARKDASHGTEVSILRWSRLRSASLDKGLLWPISLIVTAVCFVVLWISGLNAEQRRIQTLPPAERGAFYERTLSNVRAICSPSGASALRQYCGEQAILLAGLPECGDECRTLIRPLLPQPTR